MFLGLGLVLGACEVLSPQNPTPFLVTATPPPQVIIVTNTPTPSPSPVLAPTLLFTPNQSQTEAASLQTPDASPSALITFTKTFTPTPTDTPATPGAAILPVGGLQVVGGTPGECISPPSGGFAAVYFSNPDLASQVGCPLDQANRVNNAFQPYEQGAMIWVADSLGASGGGGIYAIYNNGTYQRFSDTWADGIDPVSTGLTPPEGRIEPIRGFGKVWRESGNVRDSLGWATDGEQGGEAVVQIFERGEMLYVPQTGQTYILVSGQPSTWTSIQAPF